MRVLVEELEFSDGIIFRLDSFPTTIRGRQHGPTGLVLFYLAGS